MMETVAIGEDMVRGDLVFLDRDDKGKATARLLRQGGVEAVEGMATRDLKAGWMAWYNAGNGDLGVEEFDPTVDPSR